MTIPNPVTEAVARAICKARFERENLVGITESVIQRDLYVEKRWPEYEADANAAILAHLLAIREQSAEMIMTGIIERHETGTPEAWKLATANIYTVMIDQLIASAREAGA